MTHDRARCHGCGLTLPATRLVPRCPAARDDDDIDHVLRPQLGALPDVATIDAGELNPFIAYRELLLVTRLQADDDAARLETLRRLDRAIEQASGRGFRRTPLGRQPALARALALDVELWIKDETAGVGGSHKARHLMGLLLHQYMSRGTSASSPASRPRLAIASCGNAALAAATLAHAVRWPLSVFVPPDAAPDILAHLRRLGADIQLCPRERDLPGDPCVRAFAEAVDQGALPFTVQGPFNGLCTDGGQTLAYELVDQLAHEPGAPALDLLFVQVGGGALACSVYDGLRHALAAGLGNLRRLPRICVVQPERAHPLVRAYEQFAVDVGDRVGPAAQAPRDPRARADWLRSDAIRPITRALLGEISRARGRYMRAWRPAPTSLARGILDDETYDWYGVLTGMLETGGFPLLARESTLTRARDAGREHVETTIPVSYTGAAGLAGLLTAHERGLLRAGERAGVLFTGGGS